MGTEEAPASKNKKKKKKKKNPTGVDADAGKEVLGVVDENTAKDEDAAEDNVITCAVCKKENPSKRCSKMHKKCLKKMFCNETCEVLAHKKEDDKTALVKKE